MSDILQAARDRILDENRKALPFVPKDLKQTWEKQAAWAGFVAGAWAGGLYGSHIGIAIGGPIGAINGMIPGAIIGGIMGAFGAAKAGAKFEKKPYVTTRPNNTDGGQGATGYRLTSDSPTGDQSRFPTERLIDSSYSLVYRHCKHCKKNQPMSKLSDHSRMQCRGCLKIL